MRIMKLIELFANLFAPKANMFNPDANASGTVAPLMVRVKKHEKYPDAEMPIKAHPSDAGADLVCVDLEYDEELDVWTIHSGLCFEIPEGHVGLLFPRSSIFRTGMGMTNCVGVIDSHYRGEVTAKMRFVSTGRGIEPYGTGDKFAQMVIIPYPAVEYMEAEELTDTDRGEGGYGSTGK